MAKTKTSTATQTPGGSSAVKISNKKSTGSRICMWADRARKRSEAKDRKKEAWAQNPLERIRTLDDRLGRGLGAKRERARLVGKLSTVQYTD